MKKSILLTIILITFFNLNGQVWRMYNVYSLNKIAIDKLGNKWFATNDGVFKFDNSSWMKYDTTNGLTSQFISSILIDNNGNKWFGTYNLKNDSVAPVIKFDDQKWSSFNAVDSPSGYGYSVVRDIAEDTTGILWFATSSGVSMFDGAQWKHYYIEDGLPSNYIRCIAIDKNNNKWFGTQNGLSKYDGSTWTTYYTSDSASGVTGNCILSLAIDKYNTLWAGGAYGLYKLQNKYLINANSSIQTSVDAISFDKSGVMWLGIYNGFIKYDGTWHTRITSANDGVGSIVVDLNNDIWLGTFSWSLKYSNIPLVLNVSPIILELDTLKSSKDYFIINSNTSWTLNIQDYGEFGYNWINLNKYSGSDNDTIWVSTFKDYSGYPRSIDVQISEFGMKTKTVTIKQGVNTNVSTIETSKLNIYPNPVKDYFIIENINHKPIDKLEIYSFEGLLRKSQLNLKSIIDMSNFNEGLYFLKIYTDNSIIVKKILKVDK
jgi:ligand-binding sensor domain-containing protein